MKKILFLICFWLSASMAMAQNDTIQAKQAGDFVGKTKWVACEVAGARAAKEANKPNFLNVGAVYPNHIFTVVVVGDFAKIYGLDIATLKGKTVYVLGKIEVFKDIPQIKNPEKIILKK